MFILGAGLINFYGQVGLQCEVCLCKALFFLSTFIPAVCYLALNISHVLSQISDRRQMRDIFFYFALRVSYNITVLLGTIILDVYFNMTFLLRNVTIQ